MVDEYANLAKYLEAAAKIEDKQERMKIVASGIIANLSINICKMGGKGPLNPLLGETFQGKLSNGTEIYVEQMSMHPHTTLVYVVGPENLFTVNSVVKVTFHNHLIINSLKSKSE
jgi:hypothetical protein